MHIKGSAHSFILIRSKYKRDSIKNIRVSFRRRRERNAYWFEWQRAGRVAQVFAGVQWGKDSDGN